jgi:hypothetical protein
MTGPPYITTMEPLRLLSLAGGIYSSGYEPIRCRKKPPVLYKYTKASYGMLTHGRIMVRDLWSYRHPTTGFTDAHVDCQEGNFDVYIRDATRINSSIIRVDGVQRLMSPTEKSIFSAFVSPHVQNHRMKEVKIEFIPKQGLVYCTTSVRNNNLLSAFDADTCIAIHDPLRFARIISEALLSRGMLSSPNCFIEPCIYRERLLLLDRNSLHDPVFLKPQKYSEQCEWRFWWPDYPSRLSISEVLEIPAIIPLLSEVK